MSPRPVHRSLTLVQVYRLQIRLIVMVTQLVRCLFHIAHSCLLTLLLEYLPQGHNSRRHLVLLHGTFHHGPQGLYFRGGNHLMSVMATKMSSSLLIHQFQFLLIVQSAIRFGLDLLRAMSASAVGVGTSTQRRLNLLITSVSKQKSGESLHHLVHWHLRRVGQTHIFEYVVCSWMALLWPSHSGGHWWWHSEPLNFSLTRTQSRVNLVYTSEHCVVSCWECLYACFVTPHCSCFLYSIFCMVLCLVFALSCLAYSYHFLSFNMHSWVLCSIDYIPVIYTICMVEFCVALQYRVVMGVALVG